MTVASGTINGTDPSGDTWDVFGGSPDPYVCLTIGNQARACTATAQDTLSPVWNEAFPSATTAAIQTGIVVEIWDEDVSSNDSICSAGTVVPSDANLAAGQMSAGCQYGTVTLAFTPTN